MFYNVTWSANVIPLERAFPKEAFIGTWHISSRACMKCQTLAQIIMTKFSFKCYQKNMSVQTQT